MASMVESLLLRRAPALRDRIARIHPLIPSAEKGAHVLHAALLQHERRTGARELVASGTVGDDRLPALLDHLRDLLVLSRPRHQPFERQQHRARDVGDLVCRLLLEKKKKERTMTTGNNVD